MILNRLSDYIDPDDLEIHIYKNGIYIVNYTLISSFNDKKIDIDKNNKKISIIGNKLVISISPLNILSVMFTTFLFE